MESGKLEKKKVRHNLVGARSLKGLGTSGRLGLEGLLLFMYPNYVSSGLLTAWRAAERFYAEGFGFLFDNTSNVVLVFASLFPLSLPFTYCCDCEYLWFRLFIDSIISLCSCSTHLLLDIKLESIFLLLGSKHSRVLYTLIELSIGIRAGTLVVV